MIEKPLKRRIRRPGVSELVLDDLLTYVAAIRQGFHLVPPNFDLQDVESQPLAKQIIAKLVREIVAKQNCGIYSRPHELLSGLGEEVFGEPSAGETNYSGQRITPEATDRVLRRVLEVMIQTIVQSPPHDPKPKYDSKKILALAASLTKSSKKLNTAFRDIELYQRIGLILQDDLAARDRLLRIGEEIEWAGDQLRAVARQKLRKLRLGSPNPQVRLSLYLARFIQYATGRLQYPQVSSLLQGAFSAAGQTLPKWVGRLEIEMHSQKKDRGKRSKVITG